MENTSSLEDNHVGLNTGPWAVPLGCVLLLLQVITIVSIIKTQSLRVHFKLLVGSLLTTDSLMALVTVLPRQALCRTRMACGLVSLLGTSMSVLAITVDRTLALALPAAYRTSVTLPKSLAALAAVWLTTLLLTAIVVFNGLSTGAQCNAVLVISTEGLSVVGYVLPSIVLVVCCLYVYIGVQIVKRRRVTVSLNMTARGVVGAEPSPDAEEGAVETGTNAQHSTNRWDSCATGIVMPPAGSFLLGYFPLSAYVLWVIYSDVDREAEARSEHVLMIMAFPLVNSVLDPFVYFWRLQDSRSLLTRAWRRLRSVCTRETTSVDLQ